MGIGNATTYCVTCIFRVLQQCSLIVPFSHFDFEGALMIFAWLVFVNVGVLLPRYYKTAWPGEELCGKQVWFQVEQLCLRLIAIHCKKIPYFQDLHLITQLRFTKTYLMPITIIYKSNYPVAIWVAFCWIIMIYSFYY